VVSLPSQHVDALALYAVEAQQESLGPYSWLAQQDLSVLLYAAPPQEPGEPGASSHRVVTFGWVEEPEPGTSAAQHEICRRRPYWSGAGYVPAAAAGQEGAAADAQGRAAGGPGLQPQQAQQQQHALELG
jgi:hypothetical protein